MRKSDISIIGMGQLGTALLWVMTEHDYRVNSVFNRSEIDEELIRQFPETDFYSRIPGGEEHLGECIFLTVADDAIEEVAHQLNKNYDMEGKNVVHCSGTHPSALLQFLKDEGAAIASFHPMKAITSDTKNFKQIWFDLEGDEALLSLLSSLVDSIGAHWFIVSPEAKPFLHASAVVTSNYLVVLTNLAARISAKADVNEKVLLKALTPLMKNTLQNVNELGSYEALTGPVIRGDVETVRMHVELLNDSPDLVRMYKTFGLGALHIAREKNGEKREYKAIQEVLS